MTIANYLLELARTLPPYYRSPANDVPAGARTPVDAVAWELQGLGGIHYYAVGVNPNEPGAQRLSVTPEDRPF